MTALRLDDAEQALRNLTECLVLSYRFDVAHRTLALVSDYPFRSTGSAREFVAFVFHDVAAFDRESGNLELFRNVRESYRSGACGRPVVVQAMDFEAAAAGKKRIELWLGLNFGGLSFEYAWVEGFTRASLVEEVGGTFVYRDLHTDEKFDFLAPFAGLLEGGTEPDMHEGPDPE